MTIDNSVKNRTVGALLLQTAILTISTLLSYRESFTWWDFGRGLALMATTYFGALLLVAVYLTFHHYSYTVKRSTLQLWGVFCILLGIFPLFVGLFGTIFSTSIHTFLNALFYLFTVILGITPPTLILLFATKETETSGDK